MLCYYMWYSRMLASCVQYQHEYTTIPTSHVSTIPEDEYIHDVRV